MSIISIFVLTVGENIIFESLDRLIPSCPPHKLTIMYDTCGRGIDYKYLDRLMERTNDVVVLTRDHGAAAAWGWATLYLEYDFLVLVAPDFLVHKGWFDRAFSYFNDPLVGIVGEAWRPSLGMGAAINDRDRGIDGICIVRKTAVNAAGGISPAFNGRGPFHTEWHRRIAANGYKYIAIDGLCDHGKADLQHTGRDMQPRSIWEPELHLDNLTYLKMDKLKYTGYNWWGKK